MKKEEKIIAIDFDGVIHSFKSGWTGFNKISDKPTKGAIKWLSNFIKQYCIKNNYKIVIFSSRCETYQGKRLIKNWLKNNGLPLSYIKILTFSYMKPFAHVIVDDRVICFDGSFKNLTKKIINFSPWHKNGIW